MNKDGITITIGTTDIDVEQAKPASLVKDSRVGKKHRGKVVSFKPYGFFVETDDGHFGLVHGKNIAGWKWGQRFDRVFRYGTEVEVEVIDVEAETDRMSFSCSLPAGAAGDEEPAEDVSEEPRSVPETRQEVAERWMNENPDNSKIAQDWLKAELSDGPIYGPLTNVLCERFGVPIPVSYWIRRFPEFVCYSGQGDNPSDLPAVALAAKAGDVAYWARIKRTVNDLSDARNKKEDVTAKLGALAQRLDRARFPGSEWIADYQKTCKGLVRGKGVYGVGDTVERLVVPMLGQLGWDVSPANAALVRGDGTGFDVKLFGGTAESGNVSVAVKFAPAGTSFASVAGVVEQVLGLYNRLGGDGAADTKVVWTDGLEWVVFTREVLSRCIGILADHRGEELLAEMNGPDGGTALRRIALPAEATPFGWLAPFADLTALVGR